MEQNEEANSLNVTLKNTMNEDATSHNTMSLNTSNSNVTNDNANVANDNANVANDNANVTNDNATYAAALQKSMEIEKQLDQNADKFRVLTGDRPTGNLHIGHLFGSVENRVRIQNKGIETFIIIADYQVLTDRESYENIATHVKELVIDYLAAGLDPFHQKTYIFPHSHVPELNQLIVPFLSMVTSAELDRNPTVKEEIQAANLKNINAGMYTYPVHQAADILSVKGNLVPVGKDQLPHLEMTRTIARRFNRKFGKDGKVFREPDALLAKVPVILGLDGGQKMSKSRNNSIYLKDSADATQQAIKKAKTDSIRTIAYDPVNRPEVANLLKLIELCTGEEASMVAERIGDGGSAKLKMLVTEALNAYLEPIRLKRRTIEQDAELVREVLKKGIQRAREEAERTLTEVRRAMNMEI